MRRQLLIIMTIILTPIVLSGQNEEVKKIKTGNWLELSIQAMDYEGQNLSFDKIGQLPEFPGGFDSLATFLVDSLSYPESALKDSVEGRVFLTFIVDSVGRIREVEIVYGVRNDLDSTCISAVSKLPDWKPGLAWNGKPIKFKFGLPIKFTLEERRKKTRHNTK